MTDTRTVLERLRAGETVPMREFTASDRAALVPDFADRWRDALRDVPRPVDAERDARTEAA